MQEMPQLQEQQQKSPKKDNPFGLVLLICLGILAIFIIPIFVLKYSNGALRLISPVATVIIHKDQEPAEGETDDVKEESEVDVYFFPDNFKSYEELYGKELGTVPEDQP